MTKGCPPKEARRAARLHFGNVTQAREDSRQFWGFRWLDELGQDLRFAFRSFAKNPGSTAAAVLTLALGLGVGTAVFSVVNALLFKPLPYKDPDRLVMVWSVNPREGIDVEQARSQRTSMSTPEFEAWEESGIFESMVAFGGGNGTELHPEPQTIWGFAVSSGFFETTGIQPFLGRGFLPEEHRAGDPFNRVLVLTHAYWSRRFNQDPDVIGKKLVMEGPKESEPAEIIGVLPRGVNFYQRSKEAIVPLLWEFSRGNRALRVMARLRDGVSLKQAQARADVFSEGLANEFPESNKGWKVELVPVMEDHAGDVQTALLALLAAGRLRVVRRLLQRRQFVSCPVCISFARDRYAHCAGRLPHACSSPALDREYAPLDHRRTVWIWIGYGHRSLLSLRYSGTARNVQPASPTGRH